MCHICSLRRTIVGDKSWENVHVTKSLMLFKMISGLKVNFHKSLMVGVNAGATW